VLDGDVSNSTYTYLFAQKHPERFFEAKIAEQNMVSAGVGLSAGGKIPFVNSFAKFIARAYDQIEMASVSRANLKLVGSHAGVSLGADGPSQMSLADVAYFRSYTRTDAGQYAPACIVLQPSDAVCAYRLTELLANHRGLAYMRTHRPDAPFIHPFDEQFELGGCKQLREGRDLTIVSSGFMVTVALRAAEKLAADSIHCNVFDAYSFPLDARCVLSAAHRAGGKILSVEDNYLGGLYDELAEAATLEGIAVKGLTCRRIPKSARTADEVFAYVGVSVDHVVRQAKAGRGERRGSSPPYGSD
jgi:transketolase